jgi:predicted transcriptional regulator
MMVFSQSAWRTVSPKGRKILSLNILQQNIPFLLMNKRRLVMLLKQVRSDAGLTQSELAERLHQSQSYVSKYESGEQRLDLMEIEAVCNAVNVSLIDFIKRYLES